MMVSEVRNLDDDDNMKNNGHVKLAENLNKLMKKKNLSASTVARAVNMNKSTLHNYCNGVVPRNLQTLHNLAAYFEVTFQDLLFGAQQMVEPNKQAQNIEGKYEITIRQIDN